MPKEDPFVNRAQLLKAIKRYPEIWDSNNKLHMCRSVTAPMWHEIAEQFGGHVSTVKLQSIWSQMKYHYHNLVHRQILHKERFTTKWEHFEPMSFMYNITVAKIVGAATGNAGLRDTPTKLSTNATTTASTTQMGVGIGVEAGSGVGVGVIGIDVGVQLTQFSGFSGLVPPAAFTIETSTMPVRKPGRPGSFNNSMRGRIIDAIKARPILWAGRQKDYKLGQNRTSAIWKEVAAELGLTPSLIQTRWSIIKQRFVDELQKERHAFYGRETFHSNWEHFERMSFMRDVLAKKVDEREQTREHIQEIVSEKHHQQQQQQQMQQIEQQQQHLQHNTREPIRYIRTTAAAGCDAAANITPSIFLSTGQTVQQQHNTAGALTMYDENGGELVLSNAHNSPAMSGVLAGQVITGSGSRRRIKNENDLEWDPFEMILHVPSGPIE